MPPSSRVITSGTAGAEALQPFAFAPLYAPPSAPARALDPEALSAARAEGVAEGRAACDIEIADLQAEIERLGAALDDASAQTDIAATVAAASARLEEAWREAVHAREPEMAALALDAAEAVLAAPLTAEQRVATASAVSHAIDSLATGAPITVALHPVDLLHVQETGLAESVSATHAGLRWEPDATLAEGDWTVTTPEAAVHRLRAPMIAVVRERLGLPATP